MKYQGLIVAIMGHGTTTITKELAEMLLDEKVNIVIAYDETPTEFSDKQMRSLKELHKLTNDRIFDINPITIRDEQPNKYFHKPRNNFKIK